MANTQPKRMWRQWRGQAPRQNGRAVKLFAAKSRPTESKNGYGSELKREQCSASLLVYVWQRALNRPRLPLVSGSVLLYSLVESAVGLALWLAMPSNRNVGVA